MGVSLSLVNAERSHDPGNSERAIVRRLIDSAETMPRGRNFQRFMSYRTTQVQRCTALLRFVHRRATIQNENHLIGSRSPFRNGCLPRHSRGIVATDDTVVTFSASNWRRGSIGGIVPGESRIIVQNVRRFERNIFPTRSYGRGNPL